MKPTGDAAPIGAAPGVDGESFQDIEAAGLASWLQRLRQELRTKQYRCGLLLRSGCEGAVANGERGTANTPTNISTKSWD